MARKKRDSSSPGVPAWMVTYGDLMSLLLTFFVLIVSFSSTEIDKFKAAMESFREGLGFLPSLNSIVPAVNLRSVKSQAEQSETIIEEVEQMQKENASLDFIEMYNTPQGVRLILSDSLLFDSGSASLTTVFQNLLLRLGVMIKQRTFDIVRVEGHTDNVPISTPRFPSNWELSAGRAIQVVRFLAENATVPAEKLSGVGYGEFRPRASNETPAGRARNRRVEIFLEFARPESTVLPPVQEETP